MVESGVGIAQSILKLPSRPVTLTFVATNWALTAAPVRAAAATAQRIAILLGKKSTTKLYTGTWYG